MWYIPSNVTANQGIVLGEIVRQEDIEPSIKNTLSPRHVLEVLIPTIPTEDTINKRHETLSICGGLRGWAFSNIKYFNQRHLYNTEKQIIYQFLYNILHLILHYLCLLCFIKQLDIIKANPSAHRGIHLGMFLSNEAVFFQPLKSSWEKADSLSKKVHYKTMF